MSDEIQPTTETTTPEKRSRKPPISWEDFLRLWCESSSLADMAKRSGLAVATIQTAAKVLANAGFKLPKMITLPSTRAVAGNPDIDKLNELLAQLRPPKKPD